MNRFEESIELLIVMLQVAIIGRLRKALDFSCLVVMFWVLKGI